jgi:hypothetical protein
VEDSDSGLAFVELAQHDIGVFGSCDAIALLCTVKAGARRVLYMWLGSEVCMLQLVYAISHCVRVW